MSWKTPAFAEINMSAEIGAYQEDGSGGGNQPPCTAPAPSARPPRAEELER
jgi:coenzyme PQQ precursor peptide PqqA